MLHTSDSAQDSTAPSTTGKAAAPPGALRALPPLDVNRALKVVQQRLADAQKNLEEMRRANACLKSELASLAEREAQTSHDAYHDALTHLPNRRLLLDRLDQALQQALRQPKEVVLMLLDLDGFKAVNDKLGHEAGDELLRAVAKRLLGCIRSTDTACRYGGDEFVVMLPEVSGTDHGLHVEQKIRSQLAAPYVINGVEIRMGVSLGSAVFPANGRNRPALLQHADAAMYHAKTNARFRAR